MLYVVKDYLQALRFVVSRGSVLLRLLAPALLSILALPFFFWGVWSWNEAIVASLTPSFWESFFSWIIWLLYLLISLVTASALSAGCIFLLFGFFLESALEVLLREEGFRIPETPGTSALLLSILRSIKDEVPRTALFVGLSLLALAASLVPPFFLVAPVILAASLGVNAFDLPLALIGKRFKERITVVKARKGATLAVGAIAALLVLIPFLGVFFVGLSHFAAVFQLSRWEEIERSR